MNVKVCDFCSKEIEGQNYYVQIQRFKTPTSVKLQNISMRYDICLGCIKKLGMKTDDVEA